MKAWTSSSVITSYSIHYTKLYEGVITPEVDALRDRFAFPGMKVLQFAFGSGPDNPRITSYNVCYTKLLRSMHLANRA